MGSVRPIGCTSLVLILAACVPATPIQSGSLPKTHAKVVTGEHLRITGVSKFGEVTPTLYRGDQPSHRGFVHLAQMGINIVVDTGRSHKNKTLVEQLGMRYVSIPWHCPFPRDKTFVEFLKLIKDNPGKKIFVHCRYGDGRTGMMIAAYRMKEQGWTAQEALREMRDYGFKGLHALVCPGLTRYEKSFPQRLKEDPALRGIN